jgi:hypothetical protein
MQLNVNFWAVLVAAIIEMGIGALWYSPVLFARPWMRAMGKTEADMKATGGAASGYVGSLIASLVSAYILAHFVAYAASFTGDVSAWGGVIGGFWAWLGFTAATGITSVLFEGRKWSLYLINAGYYFVAFVVMGALLAVWH